LPTARVGLSARERLERARRPGVGVPAARALSGEVLRDLHLGVGDAALAPRGPVSTEPAAGPWATAVPPGRGRLGARRRSRDRALWDRRLAHVDARPVLDDAAAARPRD